MKKAFWIKKEDFLKQQAENPSSFPIELTKTVHNALKNEATWERIFSQLPENIQDELRTNQISPKDFHDYLEDPVEFYIAKANTLLVANDNKNDFDLEGFVKSFDWAFITIKGKINQALNRKSDKDIEFLKRILKNKEELIKYTRLVIEKINTMYLTSGLFGGDDFFIKIKGEINDRTEI